MSYKKSSAVILFMIFIFSGQTGMFAQETLRVDEVTALPGEKSSGFILVPEGSDGPEVQIPVTVINGTEPGPVLALTAGVHGYEYPPVLALQRISRKLKPSGLSGAVIIVHVVNVPSFLKRTVYYNPYDWKNQNRAFPGKIDGSMTERIAYMVTREVIARCDYLIDNHCGDGNEDLATYLYCAETGDTEFDKKIRDLAVNFGFRVIIHDRNIPKDVNTPTWCSKAAIVRGKPALTVECGKLGRTDEQYVKKICGGIYNTLRHLKMIQGEPELLSDPVWVEKTTYVRSRSEGLFYPLVRGGEHVEKGELLGYLTDFFGNVIQKARAPHDGIVMYIISTPPLSEGEPMVKIGAF